MSRRPSSLRRVTGPGRLLAACLVGSGLTAGGLIACDGQALAAEGPAGEAGQTVRAARTCFSDSIRVTGFAMPRGESYVSINVEGFRVAEVLVREDDTVAVDQDLIRLARVGDDNGRGLPATATLKAPAAGTVVRRNVRVGQLTRAGADPMLRIVTDPALDLMVEVPSLYATRVKASTPAEILAGAEGVSVPGTVRVPAVEIDPATQFGRARVAVPAGTALRPGDFARAILDLGQSCGVGVPRTAILRGSDTVSVRVVRDGKTETRRVKLGLSSADTIEIRDGVAEGEAVVADAGAAL